MLDLQCHGDDIRIAIHADILALRDAPINGVLLRPLGAAIESEYTLAPDQCTGSIMMQAVDESIAAAAQQWLLGTAIGRVQCEAIASGFAAAYRDSGAAIARRCTEDVILGCDLSVGCSSGAYPEN